MGVIRWVVDRWHQRLRTIDMETLWPACRGLANDLDHAKAAFAAHAHQDPAWQALGESEIDRIIAGLS